MPGTSDLAKTLRSGKPEAQIDAAKQLGKRVTDEAFAELEKAMVGFSKQPPKVRSAIASAFQSTVRKRWRKDRPADVMPTLRQVLDSVEDDPDADTQYLVGVLIGLIQNDEEDEAVEILREVAWERQLGQPSKSALTMLVRHHEDEKAIEHMSHHLGDVSVRDTAARALFLLDPAIAAARVREQLEAAPESERGWMAEALIPHSGEPELFELIEAAFEYLPSRLGWKLADWVIEAGVYEQRQTPAVATALSWVRRWDDWLIDTLLEFPPECFTPELLAKAFDGELDTAPLFKAAPIRVVLDATNQLMKEFVDIVPQDSIVDVLIERLDEHADMKTLLEELEKRAKADDHPDSAKAAKRLGKALA